MLSLLLKKFLLLSNVLCVLSQFKVNFYLCVVFLSWPKAEKEVVSASGNYCIIFQRINIILNCYETGYLQP